MAIASSSFIAYPQEQNKSSYGISHDVQIQSPLHLSIRPISENKPDSFCLENVAVVSQQVTHYNKTEDCMWMDGLAMGLMEDKKTMQFDGHETQYSIEVKTRDKNLETGPLHEDHGWDSLSLEQAFAALKQAADLPSIETLMNITKKCRKSKDLANARSLHTHICDRGLDGHNDMGNFVVPVFAECESVVDTERLFARLVHRSEHSWTALIMGYIQSGALQNALDVYAKMQNNNGNPSSHTLVAVLKACTMLTDENKGREVHVESARLGLATDLHVGSCLIEMYASCGSLALAREVFDKLLFRNVVSWTSLISGYAEYGQFEEAIAQFEQMGMANVSPNALTFACVLKACGNISALEKGREIHTDITAKAFDTDLFVGNSLVAMYAKCGALSEAQEAASKLSARDVVTWTALIAGYAEHGPPEEALSCFAQMQLEDVSPNDVTISCALKACGSIRAADKGRELHRKFVGKRLSSNLSISNSLVGMYAKCGLMSEAWAVFDQLPVRDVVSWTTIVTGFAECDLGEGAFCCFEQMQADDVAPNPVTFSCILKALSNTGLLDKGRIIHSNIIQKGFEGELSIGNSLVGLYAKSGSLVEAQEIFDKLPCRDTVSWNALIAGYAEHGPGQEALSCFERMQSEHHSPDAVTIACCLKACGNMGAIEMGRHIHMNFQLETFFKDPLIGNSLISMYAKCGSLLEARKVFDNFPVRDVVAWNAIVQGYGINHEASLAMQCFDDMHAQDLKADAITFLCLLNACSHASLILEGQEYFKEMREGYGVLPTIEHFTCMVDLLARSGRLYEAERFLEMQCPPSAGIWAALLTACKMHGEAELGLRCFQHLVHMRPGNATWFVQMSGIYSGDYRWDDARMIEVLRKSVGAKKKAACASIEVNKQVHEFIVGQDPNEELLALQKMLHSQMKTKGRVPSLDLVLKCVPDSDKEAALCEHAEKLAIAFGLVNTPQGETLRVSKNLRMCNDCHDTGKIVSKIEKREIILRDECCVHHFKDGMCSCGDMF